MNNLLKRKTLIRFENGEYFGPFIVDASCHHVQEDRCTYSLVKIGETQPSSAGNTKKERPKQ